MKQQGFEDEAVDVGGEDGGNDAEGIVESLSSYENWWPGGRRYRIGAMMEDATVVFGEGEVLMKKTDRSML